jgi:NADH-quinone oxidoreductase subunit N
VVAVLNSVLSLAVYLRIVVPMYQQPMGVVALSRLADVVWIVALAAAVAVGLAAQALLGRIV